MVNTAVPLILLFCWSTLLARWVVRNSFVQLTQDVNMTKLSPGELFCMAETCEQTRRTPQTVWHVLTSQTQVPVVHIFLEFNGSSFNNGLRLLKLTFSFWKWAIPKGYSSSNLRFSGVMLVSGRVIWGPWSIAVYPDDAWQIMSVSLRLVTGGL